ncbi:MAG: Slp family lipoprotein [Nitrospira sp.]|nr:Slp family lipoprotein [Nitrospira sp.]
MRFIVLLVMCLWLAACTTPPIFPPGMMKDVETDTFNFKAWKEEANHPTTDSMSPHHVELGGRILNVVRTLDGVIILAEEQAIEKYAGYCPECVKREYPSTFGIVFTGSLEPSMLEAGNEFAVIGTTDRPTTEMIDGIPQMLPHLIAQCLHIWKTQEAKMPDIAWEGNMGYWPPEDGIFCRANRIGSAADPIVDLVHHGSHVVSAQYSSDPPRAPTRRDGRK